MLITVANQETDGRTRGTSLKYARKQFHLVSLLARRGQCALSGPATRHFAPQQVHIHHYAGRHAVDDTADGRTMTLAERSQAEKCSEGIHFLEKLSQQLSPATYGRLPPVSVCGGCR